MPSDTALTPKGPLTGIRVIELGQIAASAFAGSRFTDLDADAVITATMMGAKYLDIQASSFIPCIPPECGVRILAITLAFKLEKRVRFRTPLQFPAIKALETCCKWLF